MNEDWKPLPNGWRIADLPPERIITHLKDVAKISKEMAAIPRIIREVPKCPENATTEEREQFYFDQQPESTKAALLRQKTRKPKDDIDYLLRPMPECLANPEAKSLDELTAKRTLDPSEVILVQGLKTGRNTLGQSTISSAEDRREKAVEAFTYSKPANLTEDEFRRLTKGSGMDAIMAAERPAEPVKSKVPWWKFWHRESSKKKWNLFDSSTWRSD